MSDGTGRPAPSGPPRGEKCETCGLTRWEGRQVAGWVSAAEAERDELRARLTVVEAERDAALESVDQSNLVEITDRWKASAFEARHAEATLAACREQNTTLRGALRGTVELCNALREHAPTLNLAAEQRLRESLALASVRSAGSTDNENGDENG